MFKFSIDQGTFFSQVYEKNFYLQRGAFVSDITWSDVNQVLHAMQVMTSYIRLHDGNGLVPESEYTEDHLHVGIHGKRFVNEALCAHLRDGATLIIDRMDSISVPIKRYCDEISRFTGQPVIANGYAAFGAKESFGKHWDSHDVFAVQLIGRKRWRVYAPTFPLPMPEQKSRDHKEDCPKDPVFDDYLNSGDILYIPRGWWHTATPSNEETFHIAVGVHPARMLHYATWICQHLLPNYLSSRYSVTNFSQDQESLEKIAVLFRDLLLDAEKLREFKKTLSDYHEVFPELSLQSAGASQAHSRDFLSGKTESFKENKVANETV